MLHFRNVYILFFLSVVEKWSRQCRLWPNTKILSTKSYEEIFPSAKRKRKLSNFICLESCFWVPSNHPFIHIKEKELQDNYWTLQSWCASVKFFLKSPGVLFRSTNNTPQVWVDTMGFVNTICPCLYHESMSVPWIIVYTMSLCLYHMSMSIPYESISVTWVLVNFMRPCLTSRSCERLWPTAKTFHWIGPTGPIQS